MLFRSSGKYFLIKVYHSNGMESWYYPVMASGNDFHFDKPGSALGLAKGKYYWQIRFRHHSVSPEAAVGADAAKRPKEWLFETKSLQDNSQSVRKKFFFSSLQKAVIGDEMMPNFEKLFENETKQ